MYSDSPLAIRSSTLNPMQLALAQAGLAAERGEVPVGAVVIDSATGDVIAAAHNLTESANDPTAHAEILAIRAAAAKLASPRLIACDLYVTLEPCAMCAQAIAHARIRRLYFGAYDIKGGGVEHGARIFAQPTCHHRPEVIGGVEESASAALLKAFFAGKR
jgi:tRNA(Arg) A34 adenosine deaminase TadA